MDAITDSLNPPKHGIKNLAIEFIGLDGKMKTRTYDLFNGDQRERIMKTLEFAVINKLELRIRVI